MVALYLDDLLIAGSTKNLVTKRESIFEAKYKMKKLTNYLAWEFIMTKNAILSILANSNILTVLWKYFKSMAQVNLGLLWMSDNKSGIIKNYLI